MKVWTQRAVFIFNTLVLMLAVTSCGNEKNHAPISIIDHQTNQYLEEDVFLDGSRSYDEDKNPISYSWKILSTPMDSLVTLSDLSLPTAHFIPDQIGEYIIQLEVSDGALTSLDEIKIVINKKLIYRNDFSTDSLSDFIIGEIGTAKVLIENGALRINPGESYLNRGFASLDFASVSPEYPLHLGESSTKVVWSVNVWNMDGEVCGACNNQFIIALANSSDPSSPTGFSYNLSGGGYAGNKMSFFQAASASSPFGPISDPIIDITDGLSTLPFVGAFRIEYDPSTLLWSLYFEQSTSNLDASEISTLAGVGVNSGFLFQDLPYLILGGYQTQSTFFDNLTVWFEYDI